MEKDISSAQDFASSIRTKKQNTGPGELKVDQHFIEDPRVSRVVEFAIKRRKNLLIVGPTGCGKSSLAVNVMARMKDQAEIFNCDGETCTDNLIGKPWTDVDAEGKGITVVAYGAAVRAYKEGKTLLLEEVDHAMPDVHASLHRIMERQSSFYTLNVGQEEIIKRNDNFCVVATANTIGSGEDSFLYAGTKVLNLAFLNRFALTVKMDYIDKPNEITIVTNKTGIDTDIAKKMVFTANDVRDAANPARIGGVSGTSGLASTVSTRDLIEWADLVVGMGKSPVEASEYAFLNRINDTDADKIRTFISNRF